MSSHKDSQELFNELMFCKDLDSFLKSNESSMTKPTLPQYLDFLLKKRNLKKSDVIVSSQLNTTYGYQIFSGQRNPTRNKLIQLAFGLQLDISETQRILKIAGVNELYPKDKRDSIILFSIKKGLDLFKTENLLYRLGQETLLNEDS